MEDRKALVRSVYTNEANYMLYLQLQSHEYYKKQQVLNIVLDHHKRLKDLYYNIRIVCNAPFQVMRAESNLRHKEVLSIPNMLGSGQPNCGEFYKNPQFYIALDKKKCINHSSVHAVNCIMSFETRDKSDIKLYLCKGNGRISHVTDENIADPSLKHAYYKP